MVIFARSGGAACVVSIGGLDIVPPMYAAASARGNIDSPTRIGTSFGNAPHFRPSRPMALGSPPSRASASLVSVGMNGASITQTIRSYSRQFQITRDNDSSAPLFLNRFHGSFATM